MGSKKKCGQSDDDLLDELIRDNSQCFHSTCKNSIRVIGMQCSLCTRIFCPTHQLPETHGCGKAARTDAKAAHPKQMNPNKAAELHGKINKRLEQMKNERKKKGAIGKP